VRDGGKEADIKAVRNLVLDVIRKPSCIILLVVSCESKYFVASIGIHPSVPDLCWQPISKTKAPGNLPNRLIARGNVQFVRTFVYLLDHYLVPHAYYGQRSSPNRTAFRMESNLPGFASLQTRKRDSSTDGIVSSSLISDRSTVASRGQKRAKTRQISSKTNLRGVI